MLKTNTRLTWFCVLMMLALSPTWTLGADILFISALDEASAESDGLLVAFIEGLGHTVTLLDDGEDEATTEEAAAAADLVVISESVGSSQIANEITEIETPMVVMENWAWDDMGISAHTGDGGVAFVTPDWEFVAPGHPLAAGLTGTVTVLSDTVSSSTPDPLRFARGIAGDEATVIARATLSDGVTYDMLFVYEKGATLAAPPLDGSPRVAADIRVALGFEWTTILVWNEDAYALFEAAINFGLGIRNQPQAYSPKPANGATDVPRGVVLGWRAGSYAETHNVYFGTDFEDVNAASADDPRDVLIGANQTETSLDVGVLDYGQTYYWRVDEVNAAPDETIYRGDVWKFEILNFLVIDDFEGYTDDEPDRIFDAWIDGFFDDDNGAVVGYAEANPDAGQHFVETSTVHSGDQSMPFIFDTDMKISEAELPLSGDAGDWTRDGVQALSLWFRGFPAVVSSFSEEAGGVYRIEATGRDIWDTVDEFHFAYKEMSGRTTIEARVDSLVNTNPFAKAGVMIRDSLEGGSRNVALFVTPENGTRFQNRTTANSIYTDTNPAGGTLAITDPNDPTYAPKWIRIEREAVGLVRVFYSENGSDWTRIALTTATGWPSPFYVGLAVTSHDVTQITEAQFSNVTLTGTGADGPWMAQDVGLNTNPAEPIYVSVNGGPAIYHSDPAATQLEAWTQWEIPLQSLADQGVNLGSVNSLALGVGTQGDKSSSGHQGQLFFDDIRLNREAAAQP